MLKKILKNLPDSDKNVVCILSGGLDSTILLYVLKEKYGDKVLALTFKYGQKHYIEISKAITTAEKLQTPHKIIDMSFLGDIVSNVSSLSGNSNIDVPNIKEVLGNPSPSTYIPFRNLIFLSLGLSFCESFNADVLCLGVQTHDLYGYWDTTSKFISRVNKVAELSRMFPISIQAPFASLSKKDEILIGKELNVPFEDTWTCYDPQIKNGEIVACGVCGSCSERIKNFMDANEKDPVNYNTHIDWRVS
jgi:7-cyano-7-deazaguanine synthase